MKTEGRFEFQTADGGTVMVKVDDTGAVSVTGSSKVEVHIPHAARGSGRKVFPKSPSDDLVVKVTIATDIPHGPVRVAVGDKPVAILWPEEHVDRNRELSL